MYTDFKMLQLLEILKAQGRIRYNRRFYEAAGILEQNAVRIINGHAHFTADHIRNVCREFNVNANWIMGLEHQIFRNPRSVNKNVNTVNS